jgi:CheY-like chemotaxis protein
MQRRKRFGEILVDARVLNEVTLGKALERQKVSGKRLGEVLEEMGIISDRDVVLILSRQFNCKTVSNISKHPFTEDVLSLVECDTALEKGIFPLKVDGRSLYLAITNPLDLETLDTVSFRTGLRVVPFLTTPSEVQEAVRRHYIKVSKVEEPEELTVMVVDDQELWRAAFQTNLKKEGLRSVQFASCAEAAKAVLKEHPHLILVDAHMAGMSGIELFRILQSNSVTREIPVIALSAKSSPEEEARLLEMGFFDFVPKPANLTRLMARVKRALKIVCGREKLPGV